jgi:hypothetical protein
MPILFPAQHKCSEASLHLGNVTVPHVATATAQGLLGWGLCCLTVLALMVAPGLIARAQEAPGIACIIRADPIIADTLGVLALRDLPGGEVLIGAKKGLFLARVQNGAVTVDSAGNADTGSVLALLPFPGGAVLIRAEKGLFLREWRTARAPSSAPAMQTPEAC